LLTATTSTLKVNYAPYLIDIILSKSIDALRHKARVKDGVLIVTLFKIIPEQWQELELNEQNEDLKNQIKSEAILKYNELETDLDLKRKEKRIADERFSTKKQMNLEENERNRLENKKEEEKRIAEEDLYATFANLENKEKSEEKTQKVQWAKSLERECPGIDEISDEDENEHEETLVRDVARGKNDDIQEIYSSTVEIHSASHQESSGQDEEDEEIKYIPPPRHTGADGNSSSSRVGITFTPRIFPTPMRESKQAEEEDWIAKNRKYLSKHGQLGGNGVNRRSGGGGDISEEDPFWLKAKGDDFYRNRDYQSAINAYSSALELDDNYISCYLNRSLCYLQLSDPLNCLSDCRDGLQILGKQLVEIGGEGSIEGNREVEEEIVKLKKLQQKLLFRKGICHCHLGEYSEALKDYQEGHASMISLEMSREGREEKDDNKSQATLAIESIANDILKLQQLELCHELKKKADTSFGQKHLLEALSLYAQALELIPYHVGCLSNRAACKIALNDLEGCVKDCTMALEILNRTENSKNLLEDLGKDSLNMMTAIIPAAGSEKRKSWYLKTLVRRGATYFQLQHFDEAIADYGLACAMDPSNTSLKHDLTNLTNLRTAAAAAAKQNTSN
jgi:dyslexia susceptibility 1 candidate gene 1 protein